MKADQGQKQWLGAMISEAGNKIRHRKDFGINSGEEMETLIGLKNKSCISPVKLEGLVPPSVTGNRIYSIRNGRKQRLGFDRDERPMVTWGRRMPDEEATGKLQMGEEGGRQGTLESRWARTDCHRLFAQ
ncbi:hypothetical protein TIFTF001_056102 [Ficus carica]|uniref:Uncharacterized protein n=1 Tax=Ficus carica TaxID=3494 RepID=A0AA88EEM8_FICCA|nr:hypothetical protein TIFTF001_056099 [Ficus carica]GMN73456.1 hypothetical protein TIFTF001_056100 [Ficus carica]GMN73458.1 hypothetical protein TIFTF001_056101 [Ficus carica]GMN73464.1 hypothetical protein TIFTF001_056102 [Ficus carica]